MRRTDLVFAALIVVPLTTIAAAALPATGSAVRLAPVHQHGANVALAGAVSSSTVNCPTVADKLPTIPAAAQAEVQRNLTLLQTQINEANTRLASSVGQGGPNFVQNAILGPLADKRTATLERIAIAIGRV